MASEASPPAGAPPPGRYAAMVRAEREKAAPAPVARGRLRERRVRHRERLLHAAAELLDAHGASISLRTVVARSGLSARTVTRHPVGTRALLLALHDFWLAHLRAYAAALDARDDALFVFLHHVVDECAQRGELLDQWAGLSPAPSPAALWEPLLIALWPLVSRAAAAGLCPPLHQTTAADWLNVLEALAPRPVGFSVDARRAQGLCALAWFRAGWTGDRRCQAAGSGQVLPLSDRAT